MWRRPPRPSAERSDARVERTLYSKPGSRPQSQRMTVGGHSSQSIIILLVVVLAAAGLFFDWKGATDNLLPEARVCSGPIGLGCLRPPNSLIAFSKAWLGFSPTRTTIVSIPVSEGAPVVTSIPSLFKTSSKADAAPLVTTCWFCTRCIHRQVSAPGADLSGDGGALKPADIVMPSLTEESVHPEDGQCAALTTKFICSAIFVGSFSGRYSRSTDIGPNLENFSIAPDWSVNSLSKRLAASSNLLSFSFSRFAVASLLALRSSSTRPLAALTSLWRPTRAVFSVLQPLVLQERVIGHFCFVIQHSYSVIRRSCHATSH